MAPLAAVRSTGGAARLVVANRDLRRVNLSLAASMTGDYAFLTAMAVWTYGHGGAAALAVYSVARLLLITAALPLSTPLLGRVSHGRFLLVVDCVRAVLMVGGAICLWSEGPLAVLLALALTVAVIGAAYRPVQMATLPRLAETPRELAAANALASTVESLAVLAGPAVAGLLLALSDVWAVFVLNAVTFGCSALLGLGSVDTRDLPTCGDVDARRGSPRVPVLREMSEGFRAVAVDPRLLLVGALSCAQTLLSGAALVFVVVIADVVVQLGDPGVGFLTAVGGVGAVVGGVVAIGRSARGRAARDFGLGVLLWAAGPLVFVLWPSPGMAFVAFAVLGLGNPLVDVNALTLVHRLAPPALLARVLVVLEAGLMATMAVGALVTPLLVSLVGLRWALALVAAPVAAAGLSCLPRLRRIDRTVAPPAKLATVRSVPLFAPLAAPAQEAIARRLTTIAVPAGRIVIREGEVGDRFYLIREGRLQARSGARVLSTMTAGDCFGEIALLRDIPRTATVVAQEDAVLEALDREDFLRALASHAQALGRAEQLVSRRLD